MRNVFTYISTVLMCLLSVTLISSCTSNTVDPPIPFEQTYLHLSHTRTNSNTEMVSLVEGVDFDRYDMLWLGGDLAALTSLDDFTMSHLDSFFDFSSKNTLWSIGDHDYTDLNRIQKYTNRLTYYSYNNNGITYFVLDTQDSLNNIIGAQQELFNKIVDTISGSSHLIIVHHKLIWMYGDSCLEEQIPYVSNGQLGNCFYCLNPNNFYTDMYPKLVEVKQKGIEVICIGGDIGFRTNEFEYTTSEGIHFLASGVSFEAAENKALVFEHNVNTKELTWEYKLISDLYRK